MGLTIGWDRYKGGTLTFVGATERGELLLLAIALSTTAIGDIVVSLERKNLTSLKYFLISVILVVLLASVAWFAAINTFEPTENEHPHPSITAIGSLVVFAVSVMTCGTARALAILR